MRARAKDIRVSKRTYDAVTPSVPKPQISRPPNTISAYHTPSTFRFHRLSSTITMAPKNLAGSQKGFISTVFDEARNPENATIVRSLAIFTVGVAFLHSSLGEILLPPM
ncbi:hypothetical protein N7451_001565 [Penicillium sp. IBT 35674x]|nr:hypothetical protein N7451_001565 [Penicillium sp. IBT 35674x]